MYTAFLFLPTVYMHAMQREERGAFSFASGLGLGLAGLGPEPSRWSGSGPFILTNNYFWQTGRGKTASSSSSSGSGLGLGLVLWFFILLFRLFEQGSCAWSWPISPRRYPVARDNGWNALRTPIAIWIPDLDVTAGMLAGRAHAKQSLMDSFFTLKYSSFLATGKVFP